MGTFDEIKETFMIPNMRTINSQTISVINQRLKENVVEHKIQAIRYKNILRIRRLSL